ncbi:MAG: 23S rRNA (guanosine(2251)-2'-O)-methyltransferase RlmB [Bacteroidia bacterium]|nr:23S rRNA (guanosine(2251)-2'-O)-methyltransferase RlmB [Bacteroidia bacterium]MCZ2277492.1 23S rRNA (guanosine(2251)-2'-O)-methyltransferase RlmB [Bacteroidia bacterium]
MTSEKKNKPVYGVNPVTEAVLAGKEIERIFIERQSRSDAIRKLKQVLKSHHIPWTDIPVEKLNRLAGHHHQGVICFLSEIEYQKTENLVPLLFESGKVPLILILDQITDVRNLGALSRSAVCLDVDFIIIPEKGSAMINADAVKTSSGALHHIPVAREKDLAVTVKFLKESGITVIGCTEKASTPISKSDFSNPCAFIMGSEEKGIELRLLRLCDSLVKIPMNNKISSLNVSVAAGILLYEANRQRQI